MALLGAHLIFHVSSIRVKLVNRGIFFSWLDSSSEPRHPHFLGFEITLKYATLGRTPLDVSSVCRRDLYRTTNNTHRRQTAMRQGGFEPAIPASERMQTHALDCAATGISVYRKVKVMQLNVKCNPQTVQTLMQYNLLKCRNRWRSVPGTS